MVGHSSDPAEKVRSGERSQRSAGSMGSVGSTGRCGAFRHPERRKASYVRKWLIWNMRTESKYLSTAKDEKPVTLLNLQNPRPLFRTQSRGSTSQRLPLSNMSHKKTGDPSSGEPPSHKSPVFLIDVSLPLPKTKFPL